MNKPLKGLMVVFCKIHATAAHMNAVICINQMIFYDVNIQPHSYDISNNVNKVLLTITGIWNLDFLRYVFPPFCISLHYSTLQVLAFEYIVAFYPLTSHHSHIHLSIKATTGEQSFGLNRGVSLSQGF